MYNALEYPLFVEATLSVPFNYDAGNGVRRILEDFKDTVKFCMGYALDALPSFSV